MGVELYFKRRPQRHLTQEFPCRRSLVRYKVEFVPENDLVFLWLDHLQRLRTSETGELQFEESRLYFWSSSMSQFEEQKNNKIKVKTNYSITKIFKECKMKKQGQKVLYLISFE